MKTKNEITLETELALIKEENRLFKGLLLAMIKCLKEDPKPYSSK